MPHATNNLMRKAMSSQQTIGGHEASIVYTDLNRCKQIVSLYKTGNLKKIPVLFLSSLLSRRFLIRVISLTLVFSLLLSSVAPSYAEGVAAVQRSRQAAIGAAAERALVHQARMQANPRERAEKMIRDTYAEWIELGAVSRLIESCDRDLFKAGAYKEGHLATKDVCQNGQCVGADVYGQACAKIALDLEWDGKSAVRNEVVMNTGKNRFDGVALSLSKLMSLTGVALADADKAYAYEEAILKEEGICKDDSWFKQLFSYQEKSDPKLARSARCETALVALETIAVLGKMYPRKYQRRAEDNIYQFIKTSKRNVAGAFGAYKAALLLMGLNSDHSYELLEKFLDSSKPTVGGTTVEAVGHALSLEGWVSSGQEAAAGRYLNIYTQRYDYRDIQLAKAWGMENACVRLENAIPDVKNKVQCPNGNLYEDLGAALAADLQNPRSAALARKIWEDGKEYHAAGRYPRPLWVGLLTGENGKWAHHYGAPAIDALKKLQQADYSDLNEGTLRRLHLKAALALAAHEKSANLANVSQWIQEQYKSVDESKYNRYYKQQHGRNTASSLDAVVAAILLGMFLYGAGARVAQLVSKTRGVKEVVITEVATPKKAPQPVGALTGKVKVTPVNESSAAVQVATVDGNAIELTLENVKPIASKALSYQGTQRAFQAPKEFKPRVAEAVDYSRFMVAKQEPSLWKVISETIGERARTLAGEIRTFGSQMGRGFWHGLKKKPLSLLVSTMLMGTPAMPGVEAFLLPRAVTEVLVEAPQGIKVVSLSGATASRLGSAVSRTARVGQSVQSGVRAAAAATSKVPAAPMGLWAPLVAATPEDMRRVGAGDRQAVRFETWNQIRNTFSKQLSDYARYLAYTQPQFNASNYNDTFDVIKGYKQQQAFEQHQYRQLQYGLNLGGLYQRQWNLPQAARQIWDGFYLTNIAPIRFKNNPFYQEAKTAHLHTPYYVLGQLLFGEDVLAEIEREDFAFWSKQPLSTLYAYSLIAPIPFLQKTQKIRRGAHIARSHNQQLRDMRNRVWQQFQEKYDSLSEEDQQKQQSLMTNPDAVRKYYHTAVEVMQQSHFPPSTKKLIIHNWQQQLDRHLQMIASLPKKSKVETEGIPVYDEKNQFVTSWPLDEQARKYMENLKDNQQLFIRPPQKENQIADNLMELVLRTYHNESKYTDTVVRSDIELVAKNDFKVTKFGWKKVLEGILLVNNRLLPLFGIYLMSGMGNMSSTIANFSKIDFTLNDTEMYVMGGISSVVMGVMSFVAGILQNRWARNADGTVNGARGRNMTMNIGMGAFLAGMIIPMLGGMTGQLGDPTDLKKLLVIASFACLGIGAAFMDVSMKPVVLAASKRGDYQALQGDLSTFKQTVGNVGNYVIPPIAMAIMSMFGKTVDWTVFFPIYGFMGLAILLVYNLSNMHQQTLELTEKVNQKKRLSFVGILKELTGKKAYNKVVRHGVAATALHGLNMGIMGLYVNRLFVEHVGGSFDMYASAGTHSVFAAVWDSLSHSWLGHSLLWFTLPIIFGRFLGTRLMKKGIHIGHHHIVKPVNNGALLMTCTAMVIAGIAAIAFGSWPIQVAGVLISALGLTNVSPIVGGFTNDRTRHVSDAVSTLLSATALLSFGGNALFGWFKDLTAATSMPWLPLLMPVLSLCYIHFFGFEIAKKQFDKQDPENENTVTPDKTPVDTPAVVLDLSQAKSYTRLGDTNVKHLAFALQDAEGKPLAVVKAGSKEELERTKRFGELVQKYQKKYPAIEIIYPKVISSNLLGLPRNTRRQIKHTIKEHLQQRDVRDIETRSEKLFVLSYLDLKGIPLTEAMSSPERIVGALHGEEVTEEEWYELSKFFEDLHQEKFQHTDLLGNLYLYRERGGKLQVTVLDFEHFPDAEYINAILTSDKTILEAWRKELIRAGMIEFDPNELSWEDMIPSDVY